MDTTIYSEILGAIKDRTNWESKMSSYYTLRFDGIKRTVKPYKNAPDVHYPLVDTIIDKLKPFFAQQIYADLVVANFVALEQIPRSLVSSAEQWFDYKVKQCSNFEREIMNGIDMMLHYGICPIKIYWNEEAGELAFEAIDPMYVIVPRMSDKIKKLDWLVHVKVMSRSAYENDKQYKQGKEFVDGIVGRGSQVSGVTTQKEQAEAAREGLTYGANKEQIVIWEVYNRTTKGWRVDYVAPCKGGDDDSVRDGYMLPDEYQEEPPFVVLRNESTTKGWYSPRGTAEILMAHELSLNKSWNTKLQFLDFFGHPVYKNDGLAPINSSDFQAAPGRILPQGVEPVMASGAPVDFQAEMQFVRALAEDRIQIPDLSSGEHLTPGRGMKGEVTATQVNAVMSLTNQSNDLRSRLFRMQLADVYNKAWELLKARADDAMDYIAEGGIASLPPELLQKKYAIHPSGSADSWNKAYKIQDATMTYQLLIGKPNVNQDELLNYFLETKDPRLAKRLYLDTGVGQQLESDKQATELLQMEAGYPSKPKPDDNDAVHLQNIGHWANHKQQKGEVPSAETAQMVLQHIMLHGQQAGAKQDKAGQAQFKAIAPVMHGLQAIMQQAGMGQEAGGQQQGFGVKESVSINYKDAPDTIKRQMEMAAGFQPAEGEPSQDDKKLLTTVATHAMKAGEKGAAQPNNSRTKAAAPQPQAQPSAEGQNVQVPTLHIPPPVIPAPIVHVKAPVVNVAPPIVHVPAPIVNVAKENRPTRIKAVRRKDGKLDYFEPEY